jgi:hypothetical protein
MARPHSPLPWSFAAKLLCRCSPEPSDGQYKRISCTFGVSAIGCTFLGPGRWSGGNKCQGKMELHMQSAGPERSGYVQGPRSSRPQYPAKVAKPPTDPVIRALASLVRLAPDLYREIDAVSSVTTAPFASTPSSDEVQPELLQCLKQGRCACYPFCLLPILLGLRSSVSYEMPMHALNLLNCRMVTRRAQNAK